MSTSSVDAAPRPPGEQSEVVLSVRDLNVRFPSEAGTVHAVRGMDFDLRAGQVLGIVGESGSGKSVTSMAIMGLLPQNARIDGEIRLGGESLLGLSDKEMSRHRGNTISMVFQDPLSSLTPVLSVGQQITDAIGNHNPQMTREQKEARAAELLDKVGIPSPAERLKNFPHEFSGGMRQRVMIAIAMANDPAVIICDEPTTALDVTVQAQVLELLKVAQRETGAAIIMITHDLGVVAGLADDLIVMYAGRPVEKGTTREVFARPSMPYTMGLLAAVPRLDVHAEHALATIPGRPPNLTDPPSGCPFAPRCPMATGLCEEGEPVLRPVPMPGADGVGPVHSAACVRLEETHLSDPRVVYGVEKVAPSAIELTPRESRRTVLEVGHLSRRFELRSRLLKRRLGTIQAVDDVSFEVREAECFSIVGESGSGKSTTLLEIMELDPPEGSTIHLAGTEIHGSKKKHRASKEQRAGIQMVFQDPTGALSPRQTVYELLAEPMQAQGWKPERITARVFELVEIVGLQPDHLDRFPNAFSGGQRQRIGIARALALDPEIIVLDEPVSALDVSIQAGVINLLQRLKSELGLSYVMVAHDLSVVRHISDRVAVMYLGRLVEIGDVEQIYENPRHPYTQALLAAIPVPDPEVETRRKHLVLEGDLPSPTDVPVGCSFRPRCPLYVMLPKDRQTVCEEVEPELEHLDGRADVDQRVACHHPTDLLGVKQTSLS
ncbi:ABC transporter ATP-binding protein [Nesterenkonia sp. HG001]|uniref:ABC transporter ATP-binding protein n=1 Tax=Nesterenkonia sp. HG001 TaxID=2983207 RepID=UPI002AC6B713|nr:ABC transporter ATP-binding protein [Nesterenkonia sp. HG001]MDZ5077514.1 ABC transporter ATP-binding protein [Nesterenkonia sp. HG001]